MTKLKASKVASDLRSRLDDAVAEWAEAHGLDEEWAYEQFDTAYLDGGGEAGLAEALRWVDTEED